MFYNKNQKLLIRIVFYFLNNKEEVIDERLPTLHLLINNEIEDEYIEYGDLYCS